MYNLQLVTVCFQGGSIIRLMHSELECYLVAEGSFANDYKGVDKVVVEEGTYN